MEAKHKTTLLFAASILAFFLLNAPIILHFQVGSFYGVPSLVVYAYTAWLFLIVLYGLIVRFTQIDKRLDSEDD